MSIHPIAILSYNRPSLLKATLSSLKSQRASIAQEDVYLFQDGPSEISTEDNVPIKECIDIFNSIFTGGNIFISPKNLGIAFNMDRAERYIFEKLKSEVAFVFEDDMVLHSHYIDMLMQLSSFMLDSERVGYVAAYGDHRATIAQQKEQRHSIVPMNHKWGFALSRRQWLLQKPYVDEYLQIVARADYRQRDHDAISKLYTRIGYGSPGTSQDGMKDVCGALTGSVKLMCKVCYGHYIGSTGVHFTPEIYRSLGYVDTKTFNGPMPKLHFPNRRVIDDIIVRDREYARSFT